MTKLFQSLTCYFASYRNLYKVSFILIIFSALSGCSSPKKEQQLTEEQIIKINQEHLTMSYEDALASGYIWFFDKNDDNKYKFTVLEEFKAKKGGVGGVLTTLLREYDNYTRFSAFSQVPMLSGKDFVQNVKYGSYEIIDLQSIISPSENPLTKEVEIDPNDKVFRINGYDYSTKFSDGTTRNFALPALNGMSIFYIKSLTNEGIVIPNSTKYIGDIFSTLNSYSPQNQVSIRRTRVDKVNFTFSGSETALLVSSGKIDMGLDYDTATNKHFRFIEFNQFNLSQIATSQISKMNFYTDANSQTPLEIDVAIINNNPQKFFGPNQEEILAYVNLSLDKRDSAAMIDTFFFVIASKKCVSATTTC